MAKNAKHQLNYEETAPSRLTQAESVRIAIEQKILNGTLSAGTIIDEAKTAEEFGVSRTPVREAIFHLAQAGLLRKPPRRRAVVASFDVSQLLNLFEAIGELEGLTARLATIRMTAQEKSALLETHELAANRLESGDKDAYAAAGRRFHYEITVGCKNDKLSEITASLAAQLIPYRRFQIEGPGRLEENQKDHDAIISAILSGESDLAGSLMRTHTVSQGEALIEIAAMRRRPL